MPELSPRTAAILGGGSALLVLGVLAGLAAAGGGATLAAAAGWSGKARVWSIAGAGVAGFIFMELFFAGDKLDSRKPKHWPHHLTRKTVPCVLYLLTLLGTLMAALVVSTVRHLSLGAILGPG